MLTFAFMHYPYLVCILFGMPSLHLFTFFNVFEVFRVMVGHVNTISSVPYIPANLSRVLKAYLLAYNWPN